MHGVAKFSGVDYCRKFVDDVVFLELFDAVVDFFT